jgi:hypothetical protein
MRIVLLALLVACKSSSPTTTTSQINPQTAGVNAFETVRVVLQHPRCQNCHPAGDAPLQGDDSHVHLQNIQRGPTGTGMAGAECTTCHRDQNPPDAFGPHLPPGLAKGWHMPTPETKLVFVGMTPTALCEQLKDPARNGNMNASALRAHLDDELVRWGWAPGFGRKPPPVSYADFIAAFESWQAAGMPCP